MKTRKNENIKESREEKGKRRKNENVYKKEWKTSRKYRKMKEKEE